MKIHLVLYKKVAHALSTTCQPVLRDFLNKSLFWSMVIQKFLTLKLETQRVTIMYEFYVFNAKIGEISTFYLRKCSPLLLFWRLLVILFTVNQSLVTLYDLDDKFGLL